MMGRFLDRISYTQLAIAALVLGLAPFSPQPHLIEKLAMLTRGELVRPIDIFDLVFHSAPIILLVLKRLRRARIEIPARR